MAVEKNDFARQILIAPLLLPCMNELQTLRPILDAIPLSELRRPDLPLSVALQEAHDLSAMLEADDAWSALVAVGLPLRAAADLPLAIAAARQAQSQWVVARDRTKPAAQREREEQGTALRRELSAACRWNLRADEQAQAVLDTIAQGDGLADLVQDLEDLATLIAHHQDHFDGDQTFDAPAQAEAARSLALDIAEGSAQGRASEDQDELRRLRDRAVLHLDRLVSDVRRAGRYAFRDDPRRAGDFSSDYLRRRRKAAQRRRSEEVEKSMMGEAAVMS